VITALLKLYLFSPALFFALAEKLGILF